MVWREFRVLFCHPSAPRRAVPGQLRATQLGILVTACAMKGGGLWKLHRYPDREFFPTAWDVPLYLWAWKGPQQPKFSKTLLHSPKHCYNHWLSARQQLRTLRSFYNTQFSLQSAKLTAPDINKNLQILLEIGTSLRNRKKLTKPQHFSTSIRSLLSIFLSIPTLDSVLSPFAFS